MEPYLPAYLKGQNRKLMFDILRREGSLSRRELSARTGVSFPTVVKAVERMLELSIVVELEDTDRTEGPGRRGRILRFYPEAYMAAGAVIEGRWATYGLADMAGHVHEAHRVPLEGYDQYDGMVALGQSIAAMCAQCPQPVLGLGIGYPSNIDTQTAIVHHYLPMNLPTPAPFSQVYPSFCAALGLPFYLENDVRLACLGEAFLQAGSAPTTHMVYIALGTGLGGAIMIDGEVRRGIHFRAGGLGVTAISRAALSLPDPAYQEHLLGRQVNLVALERLLGRALTPETALTPKEHEALCDHLAGYLSLSFYNLCALLDVDRLVLAGIIPEILGPALYERINTALCAMPVPFDLSPVAPPSSPHAGIIGGALRVFDAHIPSLLNEN